MATTQATGSGTRDDPWQLKTPSGTSESRHSADIRLHLKLGAVVPTLLCVLLVACTNSTPGATPSLGGPSTAAASPSPARTPSPTTVVTQSATPNAAPGAATTPPDGLALESIVTTLAELNLREEPGLAANRLGTIAANSQSFLVDGPREADGYPWYLVSGVGLDPDDDCVHPVDTEPHRCPIWFGWVAAAGPGGQPWLVVDDADCPTEAPYDAADFNTETGPLFLLHCYGSDTVRLRAWLPEQRARQCAGQEAVPWLACPAVELSWTDETPYGLDAAIEPESGITVPEPRQWVEITAHMDHPRASECQPSAFVDEPRQAVLYCRATLVLDSIAPTAAP